jgi:hypothetical protein
VPERLIRDTRRDSWIVVLPARDFIDSPALGRDGCRAAPGPAPCEGFLERLLPLAMLTWAMVVWALLFYFLMHL